MNYKEFKKYFTHETILHKAEIVDNEIHIIIHYCEWQLEEKQNKKGYRLIFLNYPKVPNPPNFISLYKAKRLYRENKNLLPSYVEFIKLIERGFDFSFTFNKNITNYQSMMITLYGKLILIIMLYIKI